jgi:hypothetical protein
MTEKRIPEAWIGREVVAVILHGWLDEADKRRGVTAWKHKIVIETIHEFGIVAVRQQAETLPCTFILGALYSPSANPKFRH